MNIEKVTIRDLPAIPVSELLEVLLERSRQQRKDPNLKIPRVTLGISDGSRLEGRLVDGVLSDNINRRSSCLLVKLDDPSDLAYVEPSVVTWIVVHQSSDYLELLAAGKIDPVRFIEPPSRLQLDRRLKDFSTKLAGSLPGGLEVTVDWNTVGKENPMRMVALFEVLGFLDQTLTEMLADEFAKGEIGKSVRSIVIADNPSKEVTLRDGVLRIGFPLEGDQGERLTARELQDSLNEVL